MTGSAGAGAGRRVLVTRVEGEWSDLAEALRRAGAEACFESPIEQRGPIDPEPCRRALKHLDRYAWWVFTSPNGVRFFAEAAAAAGVDPSAARGKRAAIGPATARALERRGWPADRVASDSRGEGIAAILEGAIRPDDAVLVVRPERGRPAVAEGLRALGARVEEIAFYRTVPSSRARPIADAIAAGSFAAIVFTSPSSYEALRESATDAAAFDAAMRAAVTIAIGRTTAARLEEAGRPPDGIAVAPTSQAVTRTLGVLLGIESR